MAELWIPQLFSPQVAIADLHSENFADNRCYFPCGDGRAPRRQPDLESLLIRIAIELRSWLQPIPSFPSHDINRVHP